MVKLKTPKISRIHQRVLGILPKGNKNVFFDEVHQPLHREIRQSALPSRNRRTLPEEKHVVFMGVETARDYDTKDAAVISLSYEEVLFPEAKEVLRLRYEPGEITRDQCDEVVAFVRRNKDAKFVAHCTYGEQRSRGMAHALAEMLMFMTGDNHEVYRYHVGIWANDGGRLNEGDMMTYKRIYHAFRAQRRAEKEQEKANDQVEVLPVG